MATLWITEYAELPKSSNGETIPIWGKKLRRQRITSLATTQQSALVGGDCKYVRLFTDSTTCFIDIGPNPSASSTTGEPLSTSMAEGFAVEPGLDKIAAST